jgi:hypothetical protein
VTNACLALHEEADVVAEDLLPRPCGNARKVAVTDHVATFSELREFDVGPSLLVPHQDLRKLGLMN